jgi:hypothetical protein
MLSNLVGSIAKSAPKTANFIKGIFGGLSRILKELGESLTKLLGTSGATVVKTGAALYAFDKASDKIFGTGEGEGENMEDGSEMASFSDNEIQTINTFNQLYPS